MWANTDGDGNDICDEREIKVSISIEEDPPVLFPFPPPPWRTRTLPAGRCAYLVKSDELTDSHSRQRPNGVCNPVRTLSKARPQPPINRLPPEILAELF